MADTKISALPAATAPAETDEFAINQGGVSKKITRALLHTDTLLNQQVSLTGDLSPAQITADQNNYNPTNLALASVLRLNADQARSITGLAGGSDGRVLVLHNVSGAVDGDIILRNENTNSTAGNRFAFGSDIVLEVGESLMIQYDSTSSRWRLVAPWRLALSSFRLKPFYATDFLGAAGAATVEAHVPWDVVLINSGTQSKIAGLATHPGILRFTSSTTADSGARCQTDVTALTLGSGGLVAEFVFRIITLTSTTIRLGFHDATTSADAVDGAYIEIPSTGAAVGKTANNSTRTTSATIATLSTNTWYRARIVVNVGATAVDFYIFDDTGNLLGSAQNTTNIPTAAGRECGHGYIATNSGTTAVALIEMDYMSLEWIRALL